MKFLPFLRRIASGWRTARRTVERVPDVVDAILVLPTLAHRLEAIEFATATLPEMHAEIARMRGDTAALTEVLLPLRGVAVRAGRLGEWRVRP
jgi:hypothetical protein